MTTEALTLTVFLLERIAEGEQAARAATAGDRTGNWWAEPQGGGVSEVSCLDVQGFITAVDVDAEHVTRHNPARVLAECEAKRRIVEMHDGSHECPSEDDNCGWWASGPCPTLLALAAVYADHEDYRDEWRP